MTTEQPHPYEFLTAENIPDYLSAHPELAARVDAGAIELIEEIGDGNLNVVFRVRDAAGASIILKQALPYVRMTGEGWPMTPERARHEAESLQAHHAAAADLVVETVLYDPDRYVLAMEDLSDHTVWRAALNAGARHDGAAAAAGRYVAAVAVATSFLGRDRGEVADAIRTPSCAPSPRISSSPSPSSTPAATPCWRRTNRTRPRWRPTRRSERRWPRASGGS